MKKLLSLIVFALCFIFISVSANAQNVNVNPGAGTYPTLKAAFDAINAGTHTGAVIVDVIGNTTEPLMAILNASGVGLASYTSVNVTPIGGAWTITGSDTVTIKLAGADNVTIDGRIAGTGRNLTVLNTSLLANATAIWLSHGGFVATDSAGARNNTIRNLEIACGVSVGTGTTVTNGILSSGTTRTVNGRNNDNNLYTANRIIKCRLGISLNGGSAVNTNDNNRILSNIVGPSSNGADNIGATGIFVQFQNNCAVSDNAVQFVGGPLANTTGGADRIGIAIGTNGWSATSTTTTTGSNYTVERNIVHDIIEERTFSAGGIVVGVTLSGPKTNNLVANNVVYNVRSNGTAGDQTVGIGSSGGPGDRFVFNSVALTGDLDPTGATSTSTNPTAAGMSKHTAAAADTASYFANNSIYVDVNSNTATLLKAAMVAPIVGFGWGSGGMNNNDYYIPTPGTNGNVTGVAGTGTVSFVTLANWQAAYTPGQDAASIQADPQYSSSTSNLKPVTGSPLVNAGIPVSGVTVDIEGNTRSATPTIGAYETTVAPILDDVGITAVVVGASPVQIISVGKGYQIKATVKNFAVNVQNAVPVYYDVNGGSAVGPVSTVGPIPQNGTEDVFFTGGNAFTPLTPGINTIRVWTLLASDQHPTANDTFTVNVNVITKLTAFPYLQTFTAPINWTIVVENVVGTTPIWGLGICVNPDGKVGDTAATANFFNASALRREVLRSPEMDFTGMTNPVLSFYTAYRSFTGGEDDSLEVVVSTDGGVNFFSATTTYNKSDASLPSLATRPGVATGYFPDSSGQWRHETVQLTNVANSANVVIGFRGKSDFGNRLWIDNVIVSNPDRTCSNIVTATGSYQCDSLLRLNFNTLPLPPKGQNFFADGSAIKERSENFNIGKFSAVEGNINVVSAPGTDNPGGGDAFVSTYLNNDPGQNIEVNTTATTQSGGIFTPSNAYHDYWYRVTYTGNDKTGFANYDLFVYLDGLVFLDPTNLYIMKRTDPTGKWVCLNTTLSGNYLVATGLNDFSDFAIGGSEPLPVELSSFVSVISGNNVTLNWSTSTETNNAGFDIERSAVNGSWSKIGSVGGNGTSNTPHSYSFTDRAVASGKYNYRLKQTDFNGNFEYHNLGSEVIIGVPVKFDLAQNYPNPFNPSTKINYDLPADGKVAIRLFDMSGKEVALLVNEVKTAGYHTVNFNASNLSSGVYFYSISVEANGNNFNATKKMMLVK